MQETLASMPRVPVRAVTSDGQIVVFHWTHNSPLLEHAPDKTAVCLWPSMAWEWECTVKVPDGTPMVSEKTFDCLTIPRAGTVIRAGLIALLVRYTRPRYIARVLSIPPTEVRSALARLGIRKDVRYPTEPELLDMVRAGMTNVEIAATLECTPETLQNVIRRLKYKPTRQMRIEVKKEKRKRDHINILIVAYRRARMGPVATGSRFATAMDAARIKQKRRKGRSGPHTFIRAARSV